MLPSKAKPEFTSKTRRRVIASCDGRVWLSYLFLPTEQVAATTVAERSFVQPMRDRHPLSALPEQAYPDLAMADADSGAPGARSRARLIAGMPQSASVRCRSTGVSVHGPVIRLIVSPMSESARLAPMAPSASAAARTILRSERRALRQLRSSGALDETGSPAHSTTTALAGSERQKSRTWEKISTIPLRPTGYVVGKPKSTQSKASAAPKSR